MSENQRSKGIYLLPNLFTTGGLFSGFYAVIASMQGHFTAAAVAVFVAMVFDSLDGRIARMTNTQSAFGAEYDSMADMVSFGIAPALVSYNWALSGLGKVGWLAAFIYAVGAALRLARFNTQVGIADKRYFQGLASPAAAAIVVGLVWVGSDFDIAGPTISWLVAIVTLLSGLLMVSNFRYPSFKDVDWRESSFLAILIVIGVVVIVALQPALVLFTVFALYALSGPIITIRSVKELKMEHVVGDNDDADFECNKEEKKGDEPKA
ncbi:CDP-diacylglycerol--serine O-phosphatidyltransferase [Gallaecimonas xiamenensis]|uniref:CDP-diacylglycerol--serine O-phosphatidyltransferase n=1 Tax=Gallaecimonas xiamenensis 3-C-1 TaxID=745411 RepID=K2IE29_9GAMM|nr:CDP-diacylglycerol--serine O-phosphatidyltransferase [Gallaecimonas xiamenensis]EKE68251.1 CDP-diacylglycerol--serine O-phosphatidyltransferase [Gallaecimonas xiamenensis 3-C-1]